MVKIERLGVLLIGGVKISAVGLDRGEVLADHGYFFQEELLLDLQQLVFGFLAFLDHVAEEPQGFQLHADGVDVVAGLVGGGAEPLEDLLGPSLLAD